MDREYTSITLVNQSGFDTVGKVFEEAIKHLPSDTDLVFIWDDDIYFRNHISNGVAGILKYNKPAYRPKFALIRNKYEIGKISNTLEATWVLRKEILRNTGFSKHNFTDSHRAWVWYCEENDKVYIDDKATITYCYTWNNPEGVVIHTSGIENEENSRQIHHRLSADHGDRIITPCSKEKLDELYAEFKGYIN